MTGKKLSAFVRLSLSLDDIDYDDDGGFSAYSSMTSIYRICSSKE